ncbi:MAG: squalene/phytoene synthase family protein [Bacillota bacterium]
MSEKAIEFCEDILKRVSRSFALTIPMLDDKIYKEVMITYLQDRLLDNFEDEVKNISFEKRIYLMNQVEEIFNPAKDNKKAVEIVEKEADLFSDQDLKELTANASTLKEAYDLLDNEVKEISYKWLKEMNKGMQKYLQKKVNKFEELDEYCYYVAGTVGGFLTDLIIEKSKISEEKAQILRDNFKDAGLFLQKVNLIRDIRKDIKSRDKNYWPLEELEISEEMILDKNYEDKMNKALGEMLDDVEKHISGLVQYMNNIPEGFSGYQKFFAVNNALGLATLQKIENNQDKLFYSDKKVKVGKFQFMKIISFPKKTFQKKARKLLNKD